MFVSSGAVQPESKCSRDREMQAGTHTAHQHTSYLRSERARDFVACFLHNSAQTCFVSDRRRALITGRFVNTAVHGPALDAISIRVAVVCFPLLLCPASRQHTDCAVPSLLLKPGNTPYPCPASEARAPVCPTWLTKLLWPICSWSHVEGCINTIV